MAGQYAVVGTQDAVSSGGKTAVTLKASTDTRGRIYDLLFGHGGTAADNVLVWRLRRFTAVGTGTGVTPVPTDEGEADAQLSADANHTVEPTYTAVSDLLQAAVNQRATFRWMAAPRGELIVPATADNGIGCVAESPAYTGPATASLHYYE